MSWLPRRFKARHRLYILLAVIIIVFYFLNPLSSTSLKDARLPSFQEISTSISNVQEDLSKKLTASQEISKDLNDPELEVEDPALYHISTEPLRVDFNPESNIIEVPHIIEIDEVNKALNTLNLKPLKTQNLDGDKELTEDQKMAMTLPPSDKASLVSDTIINATYKKFKNLIGFLGNKGVPPSKNYYEDLACDEIAYTSMEDERSMQFSDPIPLTDDLNDVKSLLLETEFKSLVTMGDKVGDKIEDSWFRFSGASVWLHEEQCHMMVSRVIYAPKERDSPIASFLRVQLFDANWKEIKGRRIRYLDVNKHDIDKVLRLYNDSKDDKLLDAISLKFPNILNVPFDPKVGSKELLGPEDPRIIFKDGEYSKEPIVFFNILDPKSDKRSMNAIFPLRKPNSKTGKCDLVEFKMTGTKASTTLSVEKNWTPFFDTIKIGDNKKSGGYIYFVYTLDPLVVLKCNLDSGNCEKLQDNIYFSVFSQQSEAFIRGGTELVAVPRSVIQLLNNGDTEKRLQMWVGFAKTHIKHCGCGDTTYRPSLMLLIKEDGVFRIELMTNSLDFDMDVQSWADPSSSKCGSGPNVLTPNGISFWSIINGSEEKKETAGGEENESKTPLFKDYLGLTVSEADNNVKIIFVKNVINYIFGIYNNGKYMLGDYELEEGVLDRTRKVSECMLGSSIDYCAEYGKMHSKDEVEKTID